jgi:ubiquitin-conjugating enzyme E2 Z
MSKRIAKDIENAETLKNHGIYIYYKDENVREVWALILGPDDGAYEGGLLFFKIVFPADYPFVPPEVKFLTYDRVTRFHPNLYIEGKVCLSILGTWSGPGWVSTMSLSTVLLSIQGLLDSDPMKHEPGWDKDAQIGNRELYKEWVEYKILNYTRWFQGTNLEDWQRELVLKLGSRIDEVYKKAGEKALRLSAERGEKVYHLLPYGMGGTLKWW